MAEQVFQAPALGYFFDPVAEQWVNADGFTGSPVDLAEKKVEAAKAQYEEAARQQGVAVSADEKDERIKELEEKLRQLEQKQAVEPTPAPQPQPAPVDVAPVAKDDKLVGAPAKSPK